MFYNIYIIKCKENKYYIGKTEKDPKIRFQKHLNGRGSVWTKKYKPEKLVKVYEKCDSYDEDKYTKIYMEKYGIDNVRGGSYTTTKLNQETINFLQKEIDSAQDKCRGCGQSGHFYRYCPNKHKIKNKNIINKLNKIEKELETIKNILLSKNSDKNKNSNLVDSNNLLYSKIKNKIKINKTKTLFIKKEETIAARVCRRRRKKKF